MEKKSAVLSSEETLTPSRLVIEEVVQKWKTNNLMNSVFSQDTPAWNHLNECLPALIDDIMKEI